METLTGVITSDIKSISYSPILFYFRLTDRNDKNYNLLLHRHALNFFLQAKMGSMVEVQVLKNKRGQYIVKKFNVFNSEVMF
ncbi:hypothetical protein PS423_01930 [Pediococcus acidilactici]|uniref:hypothetical protein n=2 Tax=Pediococcus acidilactici TaxID=1254 RepID=UPI002F26DB15